MSINVYNQPLYNTPGTDPYCLKLFYELILINTTFTTSEDFMAFSGFSINLGLGRKQNSHKNI